MCCRFRLGLEEYFERHLESMSGKVAYVEYSQNKIVFPSDKCPVIVIKNGFEEVQIKKWGFLSFNKKLIINAKSETINERIMFKNFSSHRCVIPIIGFFEWTQDDKHEKCFFNFKEEKISYLACIYDVEDNFVVITREANEEMRGVHNRMPILLKENEVHNYLLNKTRIEDIYKTMNVKLNMSK